MLARRRPARTHGPLSTASPSLLSRLAARGLSGRLLVLTAVFVLLGEVLIYVPSIARYRADFLEERIEAARIAALAVEAASGGAVAEGLRDALLDRAQVLSLSIRKEGSRTLILGGAPPTEIDATFDLREASSLAAVKHAIDALRYQGRRTIRVVAAMAGAPPGTLVDITLPEAPLHVAMVDYSWRILGLSLLLAFIVGGLLFLSLHWLLVRPLSRMTASLVAFRRSPEEEAAEIRVSGRRDEIGVAERELLFMQRRVRGALRQKARLAAVGEGVAKINHDLRNMLATAALLSERLASAPDPEVQRLAAPLVSALDRATTLCTRTLSYVKEGEPEPRRTRFPLAPLVDEVARALPACESSSVAWRNEVPPELELTADRDQVYRVIANLVGNAARAVSRGAGGGTVRVSARRDASAGGTIVNVADTGPGLAEQARARLFEPFSGAAAGGTGLGLAIARDLVRNHGGEIDLVRSDGSGTIFALRFPDTPAAGAEPR